MTEDRPSLTTVHNKLTAVATDVAVIKNQLVDLADHEHRIRALEKRMWAALGIAGLIAAASPYLSRLIP